MTGPILPLANGPVRATVSVPGSKSVANRALVCAALAVGRSELSGLPGGDDTSAMIEGLGRLGIEVQRSADHVVINGCGGALPGGARVDARLAGTTSRFLTAVAALSERESTIDGGDALRRRPMGVLHDALMSMGASVRGEVVGRLPITVARGRLAGGRIRLAGDTSSQFVTALMLIAPLLDEGLTIEITSSLVSRPYVEMTAAVMSSFGATGIAVSDSVIGVEPSGYRSTNYSIEPDASSASYPLAAAAITGGRVQVPGLSGTSLQGDAIFPSLMADMGCEHSSNTEGTTLIGSSILHGIDLDMADVSDLVPTVAAVAAFADSPTTIRGVGFIRNKESDRLADLADGLRRVGCGAEVTEDGLRIVPSDPSRYEGAILPVHHDHRLAMAWSLLALRIDGVRVDDPSVVTKSWPDWWDVRNHMLGKQS
jgi:3-phosphoshikimate 1-carboxyvinyltransferase